MSFIIDWVGDTVSGYLKAGLESGGTVAGNAVGEVGGFIENSGRSVGEGTTRAISGIGEYINDYGNGITRLTSADGPVKGKKSSRPVKKACSKGADSPVQGRTLDQKQSSTAYTRQKAMQMQGSVPRPKIDPTKKTTPKEGNTAPAKRHRILNQTPGTRVQISTESKPRSVKTAPSGQSATIGARKGLNQLSSRARTGTASALQLSNSRLKYSMTGNQALAYRNLGKHHVKPSRGPEASAAVDHLGIGQSLSQAT